MIESISAITLATHDMGRAVRLYRMLGLEIILAVMKQRLQAFTLAPAISISSFNLEQKWPWWGRVIFYHSDVDALYASVIAAGYRADTAPRDAEWGDRFFHLTDPDGHELSFAWPLPLT